MIFNKFTLNLTKLLGFILLCLMARNHELSWTAVCAIMLLMSDVELTWRR